MKRKSLRPCAWRFCPNKVRGKIYCDYHFKTLKRPYMKSKEADPAYKKPAWIKFSNYKKKANPFCETGCGNETKIIHHKQPIKDGGLLLSNSNTIALCASCHRLAHMALNQETKGLDYV